MSAGHLRDSLEKVNKVQSPLHIQNLHEGIALFNEGKFYDAHEAWERDWKDSEERLFLQALIMAAGAFVHHQRGNTVHLYLFLDESVKRFKTLPSVHHSVDVGAFIKGLEEWRAKKAPNAFPQISITIPT